MTEKPKAVPVPDGHYRIECRCLNCFHRFDLDIPKGQSAQRVVGSSGGLRWGYGLPASPSLPLGGPVVVLCPNCECDTVSK